MNLVSHSSHDINTVPGGCLRLILDSRQIAKLLIEEAHSTWTSSRLCVQLVSNACSALEVTSLIQAAGQHMRWPDGRSERTDRDDRLVPRSGSGRWHQAPCYVAMLDATAAVPRTCCPLRERCRPPRGWAGPSPDLPPGTLHLVRAGHLDRFQRTGDRLQVTPGQVQVEVV
jgi:hypothetical protein